MKIGFFDSGIGGLTVLNEALKILPNENYIYYADSDNVPYGNKSKDEIKKYVFEAVDFLAKKDLKALVIACNTATSVAIEDLRKSFPFPIIGMEPAVKPAINLSNNKRILVFATELTLKETKFSKLINQIDKTQQINFIPLQELVIYAENFNFDKKIIHNYLKEKLLKINLEEYGTIVLGCTHFPYFKNDISELVPEGIQIIDGNKGTVNHLKNILGENIGHGNGNIEFYQSGRVAEKEKFTRYFDRMKEL